MCAVTMSGYTPLTIVIFEQQRIIRVYPGASFISRTVHKEVFIDDDNANGSLLPTTVPPSCATLDLIGSTGLEPRFICSALSFVLSSALRQRPNGNRVSL